VPNRADVREALRRLHAHLEPGGQLVLTAYNAWQEMQTEQIGE
jgi:hypothetical protein